MYCFQPIYSLMFGNLIQAMLIQVQKLKLHTEAAMLAMDQIIDSNKLTMTIASAIPGLSMLYYTLRSVMLFCIPGKSNLSNKSTLRQLRILVVQFERSLQALESIRDEDNRDLTLLSSPYPLSPSTSFRQQRTTFLSLSADEIPLDILKLQGKSQFLLTRIEKCIHELVKPNEYII